MKKSNAKLKKEKEEKRLFLITTASHLPQCRQANILKQRSISCSSVEQEGELRTLLESPEPSQETDPAKTAPSARREVH